MLDGDSQRVLDELRARHFPPERNHLRAHVTLFHRLPAAERPAIERRLHGAVRRLPLSGSTGPPRGLGRGVAITIECPELIALRRWIAAPFAASLSAQDRAWSWPHVTVQNKVEPEVARRLLDQLESSWRPRPLTVDGLALWRYRGGPWAPVAEFRPPASDSGRPGTR